MRRSPAGRRNARSALIAIRIFDQKAERLTHGVFEASRGLPAERSQALRSEQDLGRVADPTAFAAGKFELGADAELRTDDANALHHFDPLRMPDVQDAD